MKRLLISLKTKPAFKVVLPFILGLIFGYYLEIDPFILFCALIFISIICYLTVAFRWRYANLMLLLALLLSGAFHYTLKTNVFPKHHLRYFLNFNKRQIIKTTVTGFPQRKKDRLEVEVKVDSVIVNQTPFQTTGRAIIRFYNLDVHLENNDKVMLFSRLQAPPGERNPGEFDYKKYLAAQGIFAIVNIKSEKEILAVIPADHVSLARAICLAKSKLNHIIEILYDGQRQALMKGLLLGLRSEISADVKESFMRSGVIHVLAISGLHVGYIIIILFALFGLMRVPYRLQIFLVIFCLFLYNLLIGFESPIVRSSLMATIFLLGQLKQRPVDVLNVLSAAALIILIFNPEELFQASFQLSFAAIMSMVYIYQKLKNYLSAACIFNKLMQHKIGEKGVTLFLISLAAQLGTLPITAFYFEQISLISLLSNLIVIPLSGIIIAYGFVSLIFFFVSIHAAALLAAANSLCIEILIFLTKIAANLPLSALTIASMGLLAVMLYYVGLFLCLNLDKQAVRKMVVFSLLIFANAAMWRSIFVDKKWMQVIFFDVGQGDAALIEFPDGENMLIDAGPHVDGFDAAEFFLLPYFRRNSIHQLSSVVLSHADNDHIGGMPSIFRKMKVNHLFDTGLFHQSEVCSTYKQLVDSLGLTQHFINQPQRMDSCTGYGVFFIHPTFEFWKKYQTDINNNSLTVKIIFGRRSFLFLGDVEMEAEAALLNYGDLLKAEVLKIPHHGSETSSTLALLKIVRPKFAVISLGKNNKFGFPSSSVIHRLADLNIPVIRTDENGAVVFKTDGENLIRIR